MGWASFGLGVDGAKALTNAVVTLTLSFVVFTFGSLLVAIQVASGQYTPRIIATTLLRDNASATRLACSSSRSSSPSGRSITSRNRAAAFRGHTRVGSSARGFLFLIDYAARLLRP
jgi:hypothetical protein